MLYLKIAWLHALPSEPALLYSELDSERMETRKVEVFADGRMGLASLQATIGGTQLGELPIPGLCEIASDPQFVPSAISREEFQEIWARAVGQPEL